MFSTLRDKITAAFEILQKKYDGFTDSVDKFNQDLLEIRDLFVSIKNIVLAIFHFVGQETTILLFCTFFFLFVLNLIPFLFFNKKIRYYIGIISGVFLSFFFDYTAWSLVKYVLIMLSPIIAEYLVVKLFKAAGKSFLFILNSIMIGIRNYIASFFERQHGKSEKKFERQHGKSEKKDEKQVLKS